MQLQGDVGLVESHFSPFGDRVSVGFGHTIWYFKVMRLKWKLDSVCLEIVLILAQDRCTVCAERTIDLEIVLDAPNGTPW